MGLSKIVFSNGSERTIEVDGHKIVLRNLNTKDIIGLEIDLSLMAKDDVDIKTMLQSTIDVLSTVIISVDGEKSEGKADAKEFLMNLEQKYVNEIFSKAQVYGEAKLGEEIKN